ncbi:MAG: VTT domain-containing protein [Nitrospirota bacterium]
MTDHAGRPSYRRIVFVTLIFGTVLLMAGLMRATDAAEALAEARRVIEGLGWAGVLFYIAGFIVGSFLCISATALSVIAPLLFGPWVGFGAILAGNLAAAGAMFVVTRWAGSRWSALDQVLPEWLFRLAHGRGLLIIFYARLLLVPAPLVNYGAPLLPISMADMMWGSLLGFLPHCLSTALSVGIIRDAVLAGRWSALLRWEADLLLGVYAATLWTVHLIKRQREPLERPAQGRR